MQNSKIAQIQIVHIIQTHKGGGGDIVPLLSGGLIYHTDYKNFKMKKFMIQNNNNIYILLFYSSVLLVK